MRKITFILLYTIFLQSTAQNNFSQTIDSLNKIRELEFKRLADPITGKIPYEELEKAREETAKRQAARQVNAAISPTLTWYERGPINSLGNIKCLVRDPNNPTNKKYWAGTAYGGLWYNNDITNTSSLWNQVTGGDSWASLNISSIAFNPMNTQEIYVGTGDYFDNNSGTGSGIYKSTDGGVSFVRLNSTIPSSSITGSIAHAFLYISKIVVNTSGHIFVTTHNGLLKSVDGGASWIFLLNSQIGSDLEIGNDGIVYAVFGGYNGNSSRIYRSDDVTGNTWSDITPVTTGGKTELALANSVGQSSQIMYAFSYLNGTVNWFRKSIDGGNNWTIVTTPLLSNGNSDFIGYSISSSMVIHPNNPNVVIAAGHYITKTIDGGLTWQTNSDFLTSIDDIVIGEGGNSLVFCSNRDGVRYSTNYANPDINNDLLSYTIQNKGFRIATAGNVAMNNIADDGTILGGISKINGALHSLGASSGSFGSELGTLFIDQENPNVIISNGIILNSSLSFVASLGIGYGPQDYDSQNNIYYAFRNNNSDNTATFDYITNVGTSNNKSTFTITPALFQYTMRVGKSPNTIFFGSLGGSLFKISNVNSSPTVVRIDNNQLPTSASFSSIDLGTNDNEIIVTFSNYGVNSVWYTNNGGTTWVNKDAVGHGLPNIPIYQARFTPNAQKVVLATELGVWSTNNITDSNPNWEPSNTGLPNIRCNWIYVRAADSVLAVATQGRGLFISPMRGFLNPSIENQFNGLLLCKSGTTSINFTTVGTFPNGTSFNVELSNSSGSFTSPMVIGSGTSSPISITIPSNLTSSSNYKLRIVSAGINPKISNESAAFSVRNASENSIFISNSGNISQISGTYKFCNGTSIGLTASLNISNNPNLLPYNWSGPNGFTSNGNVLNINNSSATSAGFYTVSTNIESCPIYTATTQLILSNNLAITAFGSSIACPGGNISFGSFSGIFTNSSPMYSWSGPNSFTSTAQFPSVSNASIAASGIYTVTATFTGSCAGTATATTNVSVTNALPVSSNYSGSNCNGATITLNSYINTNTSGLTVSYNWSGPNGFTSTIQNPTLSNFGASKVGIYTVTISYTGSCSGSNTSTLNVTLSNVNVNINGTNQYCEGATTNVRGVLTLPNLSTQYTWSGPNGFSSSGDLLAISNFSSTNAGVYTVTAIYSGTCNGTATNSVIIATNTPQLYSSVGLDYCLGNNATLSVYSSATPATYSWIGPNGFTSTASNPVVSGVNASKAGIYTVSATFLGCNITATATTAIKLASVTPQYYITQNRPGGTSTTSKEFCLNTGDFLLEAKNYTNFSNTNINTVTWVGPNGFSNNSNLSSIGISTNDANNSGIYSVTITFNGCSGSATATTSVNISPEPKVTAYIGSEGITNPINTVANVCVGNFIYLDAVGSNGSNTTTYSWVGPNNFSSGNAFAYFSPPQISNIAGVYTITASQTGACAGTATATVQINFSQSTPPLLSFSPQNYTIGQPVTLTASCPSSVNWTNNTQKTSSITITPSAGQAYAAQCVTNGCVTNYSPTIQFFNCMNTLQLNANYSNYIAKIESTDTITATNKIIPISNITYDAQRSVILSPGFEVQNGSVFKAQIDGCGNN